MTKSLINIQENRFLYLDTFVIILLAFCGIGFFAKASWAATYYVDFEGGNDGNSGIATAAPWKHSPGDPNATNIPAGTTLTPGDIITFKKGISYLGAIVRGASGALVTSGTKGAITSNGVLTDSAAPFASVVAGQYIYIYHSQTSVTGTWVESCGLWKVRSKDSSSQITLADFDGVAHSTAEMTYRIINPITYTSTSSWGSGEAVIDGENTRLYLFSLGSHNYLRFEDLKFYNTGYNPSYDWQAAISGGTNIHIINCRFDTLGTSSTNTGAYTVMSYCTVTNVPWLTLNNNNPINGLFEKNTVTGGTRTLYGGRFMIIRYNTFRDINGAFEGQHADGIGFIDQGPGNDTQYFWIYGNTIDNSVEFIALYGATGGTNPSYGVIHSNVFVGRYTITGYGDSAIASQASFNMYILNNTFVGIGGAPFIHAGGFGAGSLGPFTIKNNIYYTPGNGSIWRINTDSAHGTFTFDYNHYFDASEIAFGFNVGSNDPDADSFATWQGRGFDAHSVYNTSQNPAFADAANADVHLTSSSPCINTGISFSTIFTLDKEKKPRGQGSGWEIGAYEYVQAGDTTPPAAPSGLTIN